MLTRILEKSQTPQGGWRLRFPKSGMTFNHYDYASFMRDILGHVRANDFPETVEQIEQMICEQMQLPESWCGEPPPPDKPWSGIGFQDLARGLNSAMKIIGSGFQFVDQEEAERRAAICAGCEFNVEHAACLACTGFSAALRQFLGGRSTTQDGKLKACAVCKCGTREKVWLPLESIDNSRLDYPLNCWQHTATPGS